MRPALNVASVSCDIWHHLPFGSWHVAADRLPGTPSQLLDLLNSHRLLDRRGKRLLLACQPPQQGNRSHPQRDIDGEEDEEEETLTRIGGSPVAGAHDVVDDP